MPAIALDTETTGVDELRQPIEVAYTILESFPEDPDKIFPESPVWYCQRFYPTVEISAGAFRVHGIKRTSLVGFPNYVYELLKIPEEVHYIIGHNIQFDTKTLGVNHFKEICTLKLARKLYPGFKSYSLGSLIKQFYPATHAGLTENLHGAKVDTKLSLLILRQILIDFDFDSWEALHDYSENGEKLKA